MPKLTTQSAKAKGRRLQQWVVEKLLAVFPSLESDDVQSRSMGANGEDVMLSPAARKLFPYSIECKNLFRLAIYTLYDQARSNAGKHEPLLVVKQNHRNPLVVVDAEHFFYLVARTNKG